MLSEIYSAGLFGIDGFIVTAECNGLRRLPRFSLVGLPDLAVKEAQEFVLARIKAGMICKDVDMLARESLAANGFRDEFTHSLGHGVGVHIHESPFMNTRNTEVLLENAVVSVEPGVYIDGVGGVRIEDLVVVKQEGAVNLTTLVNKNINI